MTDKDKEKIKEAVSNTEVSSVYNELNKILSKLRDQMQESVETEHLSQIYPDNPYIYKFYKNFTMNVNVSTLST